MSFHDLRKRRQQDEISKMERTANARKLGRLQQQLSNLLVEKKALNSKVVTSEFEDFRVTMQKVAHGEGRISEVSLAIARLEQYLKSEGLFKNVKTEFVRLKKEILDIHSGHPKAKRISPGIRLPTGKTFYVQAARAEAEAAGYGNYDQFGLGLQEMKTLNNAIGRLYDHLDIHNRIEPGEPGPASPLGREEMNLLKFKHQTGGEEVITDVIDKVKFFEKMLQRQKARTHMEMWKLQDENRRLKASVVNLQRDNDRYKGVHPIASKAKDKHVERIEEKHRHERKGMEVRIHELQEGLRVTLDRKVKEKDDLEKRVREDMRNLKVAIDNLHQQVFGGRLSSEEDGGVSKLSDTSDMTDITGSRHILRVEHVQQETEDLLKTLNNIKTGVNSLKNTKHELKRKAEEFVELENNIHSLEREIDELFKHTVENEESSKQAMKGKTVTEPADKLMEAQKTFSVKMMQLSATQRMLKEKEGELEDMRGCLNEITGEVARLHDTVVALELHDIAMSLDDIEGGNSKRKMASASKSTDDISEGTEKNDRNSVLKKLGFLTRAVEHLKKLSQHREETSAKLQDNINPLKVRINRLHTDLVRTSTTTGEGKLFERSESRSGKEIADEVNALLRKLSEVETVCRQLSLQSSRPKSEI